MAARSTIAADDGLARARPRRWLIAAPESERGKQVSILSLFLLTVLIVVLTVKVGSSTVPVLSLVVPVVVGGLLLGPRPLGLVLVIAFGAMTGEYFKWFGDNTLHPGAFVVLLLVAVIALLLSRDRERMGLSAGRAEELLLELRDRLRRQSEVPTLPNDWHVDLELHSAGGVDFGGDFLVSTLIDNGRTLELALVDVSGKGLDAASRSLMLSGALGGLLGSVKPADFLPAANRFLIRERWGEGFATAVHLTVDLTSGHYRLTNAGHPPAVHYLSGSGRWEITDVQGTVLGIVEEATFESIEGELGPKDALMLYTDGLIEIPGRDLSVGIDKLVGAAERLISTGFAGGGEQLIQEVAPDATDDRAIVLLWRD